MGLNHVGRPLGKRERARPVTPKETAAWCYGAFIGAVKRLAAEPQPRSTLLVEHVVSRWREYEDAQARAEAVARRMKRPKPKRVAPGGSVIPTERDAC